MKLHWISTLLVALMSALMPVGPAAANPTQEQDAGASSVVWGGRDINMQVTAQGATLEFDCGHGSVLEPIKANAKGEFVARGTYTPEHGGPITLANPPRDLPAVYKGTIDGDTMHLEVVIADKDQQPQPFTLTRGKPGRVVKCR
jgi:hypothetical protein